MRRSGKNSTNTYLTYNRHLEIEREKRSQEIDKRKHELKLEKQRKIHEEDLKKYQEKVKEFSCELILKDRLDGIKKET